MTPFIKWWSVFAPFLTLAWVPCPWPKTGAVSQEVENHKQTWPKSQCVNLLPIRMAQPPFDVRIPWSGHCFRFSAEENFVKLVKNYLHQLCLDN